MMGSISRPEALEQAVARGTPQLVGSFRFYFADERWEWSDEVARMHGYEPGAVKPNTALILSHKHPDDEAAVAKRVQRALSTGAAFSSRHRIIDTTGNVHHIIVIGDHMRDESGEVIGTSGFYVDITDTIESEVRSSLSDVLPEFAAARETIDRAKGVVMFVYGVSADRAFDILKWRSQETNTKLRDIAAQLLQDVAADGVELIPQRNRELFDHILLTTHERGCPEP